MKGGDGKGNGKSGARVWPRAGHQHGVNKTTYGEKMGNAMCDLWLGPFKCIIWAVS